MKRRHAFVISLLIGLAALAGLVAATRTAGLGRTSHRAAASPAAIAARIRALDRTEASLRQALAQKPKPTRGQAARTQKVVYVRPAPHVVTVHRPHGGEYEAEGREGGEFDD